MKVRSIWALVVGASMVGLSWSAPVDAAPGLVLGQAKKAAKKAPPPPPPDRPAAMKKKIALSPAGLKWGMSAEALAKVYDKVFDKEFVPLYQKVSPGPRMDALDAELETKKSVLRRNKILFGTLPTGIDQSELKGEYSYGNGESMTRTTLRTGTTRNFFFFADKLWLIYDEHKLREGGPYGASFEEALKILTKRFGEVAPQIVEPDYARGRNFTEARWTDGSLVVRAINREHGKVVGMAYADANIWNNLSSHRKNRVEDPHALDKDVAAATRKEEPKPPPEEKKKKK